MKSTFRHLLPFLATVVAASASGCQQSSAQNGITPHANQNDLGERSLSLLQRAARSSDGLVRANAIEALARLAPEDHLKLFREAVASPAPLVRYAGCAALGKARDRASADALLLLSKKDPDQRVRLAAAYAAVRCGRDEAGRVMVEVLTGNPDEKQRADAAFLIGELGEPKALKRLRLAVAREDSGYVAVHIESAMAKLGDADSLDKIVQYSLKSDTVTVLLALQTLAEIADPSTKKALEYRLGNRTDYLQARLIAARALGELGEDSGYELAMSGLRFTAKDENEVMQVRVNAALALGAIGKTEALSALQNLAETDRDARTQVAACFAICRILNRTTAP